MTVTLHFQSTGTVPGNARPCKMRGSSLTLGRSDSNDLVLPDPDKMISGRHCAIEDQSGNIVVIDLSTNGTFLNYGKMALGPTPTPVNDGDILSIGPYELLIELAQTAADPLRDIAPPLMDDTRAAGNADAPGASLDTLDDGDDFLDDLLGAPASGPGAVMRDQLGDDGLMPPLGEDDDFLSLPPETEEGPSRPDTVPATFDVIQTPSPKAGAIPDDWDLDLPEAPETPAPDELPVLNPFTETGNTKNPDFEKERTRAAPPPDTAPPTPAAPAGPPDAATRAFLEAVGAGSMTIPEDEMVPTFARLGHVLRVMIHGVREILMTRSSIKSEFRITQTVIAAGDNNPLKFSVSPEQTVESMIGPTTRGYLDAASATEEALRDIKAHEVAMMTGMEAALKGVLRKLEPAQLAKQIEADSGFRAVLTNKKARYWDTFEKKYGEIADQAENDFHDLFAKEFARAYQDQLEKLK